MTLAFCLALAALFVGAVVKLTHRDSRELLDGSFPGDPISPELWDHDHAWRSRWNCDQITALRRQLRQGEIPAWDYEFRLDELLAAPKPPPAVDEPPPGIILLGSNERTAMDAGGLVQSRDREKQRERAFRARYNEPQAFPSQVALLREHEAQHERLEHAQEALNLVDAAKACGMSANELRKRLGLIQSAGGMVRPPGGSRNWASHVQSPRAYSPITRRRQTPRFDAGGTYGRSGEEY